MINYLLTARKQPLDALFNRLPGGYAKKISIKNIALYIGWGYATKKAVELLQNVYNLGLNPEEV